MYILNLGQGPECCCQVSSGPKALAEGQERAESTGYMQPAVQGLGEPAWRKGASFCFSWKQLSEPSPFLKSPRGAVKASRGPAWERRQ